MQSQNSPSAASSFFKRQLPVILFIIIAALGTLFLYFRISPTQESDVISIAVSGTSRGLSTNIRKPVSGRLFLQRVPQSTGPIRVAIIVGHQGSDSGAVCDDGLTELELNTGIALKTQAILESRGIPTALLDEFDNRLTTYDGLALVSIHADSCGDFGTTATGFKTAATSFADSVKLKACLEENYQVATGLSIHENTITTHMTDYHVFRRIPPNIPALILETGFMNMDRELLVQADRPAEGVANGILCFLDR